MLEFVVEGLLSFCDYHLGRTFPSYENIYSILSIETKKMSTAGGKKRKSLTSPSNQASISKFFKGSTPKKVVSTINIFFYLYFLLFIMYLHDKISSIKQIILDQNFDCVQK